MQHIFEQPLRQFIDQSASASPTPGGGSIAALSGVLGAAMLSMVGNLTVGKEAYADVQEEVKEYLEKSAALGKELEELLARDMEVFASYMAAYRLPKNTDEEKEARQQAIQEAAKKATDVPLGIARAASELLAMAPGLARIGNRQAISDVGVGVYMAEAALRSAILNVEINLPAIKDPAFVARVQKEKLQVLDKVNGWRDEAIQLVRERMR